MSFFGSSQFRIVDTNNQQIDNQVTQYTEGTYWLRGVCNPTGAGSYPMIDSVGKQLQIPGRDILLESVFYSDILLSGTGNLDCGGATAAFGETGGDVVANSVIGGAKTNTVVFSATGDNQNTVLETNPYIIATTTGENTNPEGNLYVVLKLLVNNFF